MPTEGNAIRVIRVSRFLWALLICLALTFGMPLTKAESSEPLASDVTPSTDLKKDMVAAAGESSGPVTERPVIGATQPPSPLSWNVRAGLLVLHREKNDKVMLFTDLSGNTELLNARDLNLGVGLGLDAGLGVKLRTFGTAFGAEVRYFGIYEWSQSDGATCQTALLRRGTYSIGWINITNSLLVNADYESKLQNVELNLSWYPKERIRVFIGGRYIDIDEELKNTINDSTGFVLTTEKITVKNRLLGGQVGVEGVFLGRTDDGFSINGWAKVGYFNNDISTKATLNVPVPLPPASGRSRKGTFGSESGIGVKYAFTPNIALLARYQLLWLDKVAFAPQQVAVVDYNIGKFTAATNSVLYQGGWIGFILSW